MATTDAEVTRKPEFKVAVFPRESIRLPPGLIVHPLLRSFEESRRNCAELYDQTTSAALRTVGATESATSENERAKAKEAAE